MLTIEKRPNTLQNAGVLTAVFMIGLVGSAGVLYTIDPKNNATIVQSAETSAKEERTEQPARPAASRPTNKEGSAEAKTPTWVQPTQQVDAPSQSAPSESKNENKPKAEPEAPAEEADATSEDSSSSNAASVSSLFKWLFP